METKVARAQSVVVRATGYTCDPRMTEEQINMNCPSMRRHPGGRTATGTVPKEGQTVACPPHLKGQQVHIEGYGLRKCEDTGGAIKGARVDIFFAALPDALKVNGSLTMKVIR